MKKIVESPGFEKFIILIIAINAVTLGLETFSGLSEGFQSTLAILDHVFLVIFVVELIVKGFVYRAKFFHDPWRIFDFIVVGISLMPALGPFSVLRSLRVLRTLRMLSVVPALRKVVNGLMVAIPGLGAVATIISLIFYVGAVMATKLFGEEFPKWFGDIWLSSYSLFQIMTLESWSMGIVRPVMEVFPYAWMFFLPFIMITTFTTLNLFIAVIVNGMHAETEDAAEERAEQGHEERAELLAEMKAIKEHVSRIEHQLSK